MMAEHATDRPLFNDLSKQHMAEFASSFIRKRRNRSSASSEGEKSVSPEAKKLKDFEVTSNDKSDCDHKDEVMEALDKIGAIGEQLKTESIRKLSNCSFQWTKILYQNNLKHIAFFFTFFES